MDDSILKTIKKLIGIEASETHFDTDIMIHINSVLSILNQLGVGLDSGFSISGDEETWSSYLGTDTNLSLIKSYIALKVRLLFDPPLSSALLDTMTKMAAELEWRINVTVDPEK